MSACSAQAAPGSGDQLVPHGATALADLTKRLSEAPRRRNFKTVPMILNNPDQWDHEALSEVLAYKPATKQAWDNTEIGGPWLNVMRNSINAQVWSFRHPDFLVVSATHGSAQFALYDQEMWDKYSLAKLAGKGFETNTLIVERGAAKSTPPVARHHGRAYGPPLTIRSTAASAQPTPVTCQGLSRSPKTTRASSTVVTGTVRQSMTMMRRGCRTRRPSSIEK